MIDPNVIAEDPALLKTNLTRRCEPVATHHDVDRIVALSERRRELIAERDHLRAERNRLSKEIGQLYKQGLRDDAEAMKQRVQMGNSRIEVIEDELSQVETHRTELAMGLPNLLHPEVPEGNGDDNNVLVRLGGPEHRPEGGDAHVEIGTRLGILDFERAAKLSGARFWVLMGDGARLERALINYFVDLHTREHGYTEVMVPYLVHRDVAEGTGQLPKFESDMFKLAEPVNGADAFLIPTAEVPVTNLHRDEIVDAEALPLKYVAFTPCFRSEAGSAGRDVRGLIRVHQFHKVELVWITTPDRAEHDHQQLVTHATTCLDQLELPYRVMELCGGDVGFSAHRCFDIEVWLPSQGYREISSCSHFTDFQARRMQLRYRPALVNGKKQKARPAHTINGSGLAVGRTMVAILENHVQPDGSVAIPEVLRPYMGGQKMIVGPPT